MKTRIPPTPEQLLCMMHNAYMEVEKEKDRPNQIKLLGMMSRVSVYLHAKKHRKGHYMTTPEAIRTLTPAECMELMESVMTIGKEQAREEEGDYGQGFQFE